MVSCRVYRQSSKGNPVSFLKAITTCSSCSVNTLERFTLGPIGTSWQEVLFFHLAIVLRLTPKRLAREAILSFDNCISLRVFSVVLAHLCSSCPIIFLLGFYH